MKNLVKKFTSSQLVKTLAVAALFFVVSVAYAGDNNLIKTNTFDAAVFVAKKGNLRINVDSKRPAAITIVIKDANGEILHENLISKRTHSFGISYDCSGLEEGDYQIQISNGVDSESRTFTIQTDVIPEIRLVKGARKIEII